MTYLEAIAVVYSSYRLKGHLISNLGDAEVKDPRIVFEIACKHKLLSRPEKTIRITGSKGKGTTAHFVAKTLETAFSDQKVGLLISPEEFEHTDRIRINGRPITSEELIRRVETSAAIHEYLNHPFGPLGYASPYGIFLLLALGYFKDEKVDWLVLESGRGLRYDDLYYFLSKVGVITSIMSEHLDKIGPTLKDVTKNKVAICDHSELVLMPTKFSSYLDQEAPPNLKFINTGVSLSAPAWLSENRELGYKAACALAERSDLPKIELSSPSHLQFFRAGRRYHLEALISEDSIDTDWLGSLDPKKTYAFLCQPDDKLFEPIEDCLRQYNIPFSHIAIDSPKDSLRFDRIRRPLLGRFSEKADFLSEIESFLSHTKNENVILWGTHSFIRQVKRTVSPGH